ncbi:SMP-30/gluconolactonase/LRE family protein [Loktanella sp. SALINAS62]|uniref:SMP-30/gluconolactonase/LRE family protein n=1 Tax=Loktanella sp. SALINAS62 TaxID=2706124 RepID=UPI001B8B3B6F|nr:SMP-30/gluconolactonase/LRE family protein [Loktanella sp. SALINAS62]MBS1304300.1 SMP-30/gluconolactonase/LRE family protein [Loktanella sp. SALINAS62]
MIFDDTHCELGEGPLWHPERQQLFWFDIMSKSLHTKGQSWTFPDYVSAAGWIDRDTLLVASARALHRFEIDTGADYIVTELEPDSAHTRSNDGRADPMGGFWIGTMGIQAEPHAGKIWRFWKGELRCLFADITISNAICFAPDGRTAYFCDTPTQKIMSVALDADGWPAGDPHLHIDLSETDFRPDGAVVDAAGNLFSAQWGAGRVAVYDPQGDFIEAFQVPGRNSSCPAFGGPDRQTLFVTTARQGLDTPDDDQGRTYAIDTGYTGQKEHRVIL